ncbi:MAG: thioredoxin family protein [Smithellaceae bacterium]
MTENAVKQVMIDNKQVGIAGLDAAISRAGKSHAHLDDQTIANFLLAAVLPYNFIPDSARDLYRKALLREYRKAHGLPVEPQIHSGLHILILGAGCARCDQMQSDVRDLLSEMKIAADLRHITDIKEIARYGVMGAPALVINEKVVSVGVVPPKSSIRQWITEAYRLNHP